MAPSLVEAVQDLQVTPKSIMNERAIPTKHNEVDFTRLKNPSLQVTADQRIKMVDAPTRMPNRGEVLLQIKATGICGYVKLSKSGLSFNPRPQELIMAKF